MIRSGILLALFAIAGTGLVALTYESTKDEIAQAEREALLKKLHAVVRPSEHTNDLFNDITTVTAPQYLGTEDPVTVFRARKNGNPVAALFTVTAPDGYSGKIKLLVGIRRDGSLAGVRVLNHKETPGLGDAIEERRSHWIFSFNDRSLASTPKESWKVRRDQGEFDQITGATITSRAVVKAVRKALEYYQGNKELLFQKDFNETEANKPETQ
jgi:electron transport complex protein RnfG